MLEKRVIPCLLYKNEGLTKSVKFKNHKYVGDPINAVRIFNEKEVDELIFLDIAATGNHEPSVELVAEISAECFMPLAYGGGVTTVKQVEELLRAGAEKIIINSAAVSDPNLVKQASDLFGAQAIVIAIDAKKKLFGGYEVYTHGATKATGINLVDHVKHMEQMGAGEIFINSIDLDGTMKGLDLDLIAAVTKNTSLPVIACGGAGKLDDVKKCFSQTDVSAVAAGSLFVFHGPHKAVLINYPERREIEQIISQ